MTLLVTGGAGFIGSNFVRDRLAVSGEKIIVLDKTKTTESLNDLLTDPRLVFIQGNILDSSRIAALLQEYTPRAVINFAAETHVDRSIAFPEAFIENNIVGTFRLLESVRDFWNDLPLPEKNAFRFLHVSTDEVFGSLETEDAAFQETDRFAPNNPYSATKASADHLVRAWHSTYGLPVLTTNCSNNYGPYQLAEKLIPRMIYRALAGETLPIYGDGRNIRDWLYVGDHCRALGLVLEKGLPGETYNIGGNCEKTNLEIVHMICETLDQDFPRLDGLSYASQIAFVADRPGHDRRYAIDSRKITTELSWRPEESFALGLAKTVRWYAQNPLWKNTTY
jgi:dTDP-glucose 4,6-dehydratase